MREHGVQTPPATVVQAAALGVVTSSILSPAASASGFSLKARFDLDITPGRRGVASCGAGAR